MTRRFVQRYVWLLAAAVALWPPSQASAQQNHQVTGRVVRITGEGIPAATVLITGTTRGTQTDNDGHFRLNVPSEPTSITVRSIGFLPKTVTVGPSDNTVSVTMTEDVTKLSQVVVTGLATGVEKRSAATSTVAVDSAQVAHAGSPTVDMALQGKVPGAEIQTNSGAPGGGVQVQIRGVNTVIGAADPLFVVDGIIYSNATIPSGLYTVTESSSNPTSGQAQDDAANRMADLNPADIASIEVLKSAAASSIYGSKAANGVVIITTKRGQNGKAKFDINQRTGFSELLRGPATRRFTVAEADSLYGAATVAPYVVGNELPFYDHLQEVAGQKPINYSTLLDVNGGSNTTRYYGSLDVTSDGGIMRNSDANRQSLRANIDQQLSKKLQANFTSVFTHNVEDRGVANNDNTGASIPYALAYIPGFVSIQPQNGVYPSPALGYFGSNPLQTEQFVTNREEIGRFTGGAHATYNAFSSESNSLQFVGAAGIDFFNDETTAIAPSFLTFEQTLPQPGVSTRGNGQSEQYNWNLNAIDTYTASAFKAVTSVGTSFEDRQLRVNSTSTTGLVGTDININQGVSSQPFELNSHERTVAIYGDEQITTLKDRLLVDAGVRGERSSANGLSDKYYFYPKFAASYRVPIENLIGGGTQMKLRAAYGVTGNQPLFGQKYSILQTNCIAGGCGYAVGINGATNAIFGNPDIRPETTREIEFGTDLASWNGRADLEVTYFHRRTSDLLLPRTPAASTGFTEIISNGGEFQNEGLEIGGTITPIQMRHNISWTFGTSFTTLHNEVLSLPFPSFRPFGAGFGLAYGEFLVQTGRPITQIIGQTSFDANGNPVVTYMGQFNPDYRWSFTNTFTFQRFTLNALLDWNKGGVAENQTLSLYDCNQLAADDGTPVGQQRVQACFNGIATPFVQNTTFLKLREIRLSYDVPINAAHSIFGAEGLTISAAARNLFWVTNYFGYDPEVSNYGTQAVTRGVDLGQYPPSRSFYISVAARF